MYACICKKITDIQIKKEINEGVTTIHELTEYLDVCLECGKCKSYIEELLQWKEGYSIERIDNKDGS